MLNYCSRINSLAISIITSKDFAFLKSAKDLTDLSLYGFNIEPSFLDKLTNLRKLSLMTEDNYKTDFTKLTFLDNLDFSHDEPYDVAIDLTVEKYDTLVKMR